MLENSFSLKETQDIHRPKSLKILLVGDSCYDIYHYGNVNRISPEAPVPIFDKLYSKEQLGMASNVFQNLKMLDTDVTLLTRFFENKNRYIDIRSQQQLIRVDEKIKSHGMDSINYETIDFDSYDLVVISDYNKGFVQIQDILTIRQKFKKDIFLDTKKTNLSQFKNIFVKINQSEYSQAQSLPDPNYLIVTHGAEKVTWNNQSFIPPRVQTYDVCGAGDTFLSALAVKYTNTKNMRQAIEYAMIAAAITVKQIGVYSPSIEEIENEICQIAKNSTTISN